VLEGMKIGNRINTG